MTPESVGQPSDDRLISLPALASRSISPCRKCVGTGHLEKSGTFGGDLIHLPYGFAGGGYGGTAGVFRGVRSRIGARDGIAPLEVACAVNLMHCHRNPALLGPPDQSAGNLNLAMCHRDRALHHTINRYAKSRHVIANSSINIPKIINPPTFPPCAVTRGAREIIIKRDITKKIQTNLMFLRDFNSFKKLSL